MRPGRFTPLTPQCLRPFLIARKTFLNTPRAVLRFPAICHHGPVKMRTISRPPRYKVSGFVLPQRACTAPKAFGPRRRLRPTAHVSYHSHHSHAPTLHPYACHADSSRHSEATAEARRRRTCRAAARRRRMDFGFRLLVRRSLGEGGWTPLPCPTASFRFRNMLQHNTMTASSRFCPLQWVNPPILHRSPCSSKATIPSSSHHNRFSATLTIPISLAKQSVYHPPFCEHKTSLPRRHRGSPAQPPPDLRRRD